jgi:putative peptide zinc metalloprotease protein
VTNQSFSSSPSSFNSLDGLQRRRDLRFQQIDSLRWNVLDPVSRQSYRIGLIEHWLLTRPDGRATVDQLFKRLRAEFPRTGMSNEQLLACLTTFLRNGLLWSYGLVGTGADHSAVRSSLQGWQEWLGSTVSWQIRGINPDRWLGRCAAHTSLLFSGRAVRVWLLLALLTGLAVLLEFQRLAAQSLSLEWILHPTTAGSLLAVFIVTRGLHELGHALVCKRFGIRCPDIGLFLILGAPCVYCDVSESWQLPRRWQRAAVAAAGMYVELIIATLSAWLWLATVDGPASTLALQTMLVCSVSTIVINANPLMRFDGYYILADLLDEVNLRSKADSAAANGLRWLALGLPNRSYAGSLRRQRLLSAFSLAGWIYRAGLSLTIASVLVSIYSNWNLLWVGRLLAAAILVSWWGVPAMKLSANLWHTAQQHGRSWRLAVVTAVLVLAVTWLPLPSRQLASGWLQPAESQGIYVGTASRLVACTVPDGANVKTGDPLFQLRSDQLNTRLVRYQQASRVAAIRLEADTRRRDMHGDDIDLQHASHQLEQARSWLAAAEQERAGLHLLAPMDGRLVAMPAPTASESTAGNNSTNDDASRWEIDGSYPTTWCAPQQVGRAVATGALLASVCSDSTIAVIPLTEDQLSRVAVGTPVRLRIAHHQRVLHDCRVRSVVRIDELSSPWQAAALVSLQQASSPHGQHSAVRFAAVIEVPDEVGDLPGATVDAVFVGPSTTLFAIVSRWLQSNLRLLAD